MTFMENNNRRNVQADNGQKKQVYTQDMTSKYSTYIVLVLVLDALFGLLGIGIGFIFFLGSVLATGSIVMNILVYLLGGIFIVIYIFIIFLFNKWLVNKIMRIKNKPSKKNGQRLAFSMIYFIAILICSVSYSFLHSAIAGMFGD